MQLFLRFLSGYILAMLSCIFLTPAVELFSYLWPAYYIFALLFLSLFFIFFLAYFQRPQIGCLPYFHTWCGPSANLECRSEMCCTRLAGNTGRKKSPFWHHRTILLGYIFGTKACINNRKKTC